MPPRKPTVTLPTQRSLSWPHDSLSATSPRAMACAPGRRGRRNRGWRGSGRQAGRGRRRRGLDQRHGWWCWMVVGGVKAVVEKVPSVVRCMDAKEQGDGEEKQTPARYVARIEAALVCPSLSLIYLFREEPQVARLGSIAPGVHVPAGATILRRCTPAGVHMQDTAWGNRAGAGLGLCREA